MRNEERFSFLEQKGEVLKLLQDNNHVITETTVSLMSELSTRYFTDRQEALLRTITEYRQTGRGWIIQTLIVVCSILLSDFATFAGSVLLFHLHP